MLDRREARRLAAEGMSADAIAAAMGAHPSAVKRALDLAAPERYHRPTLAQGDLGTQVRQVLARYPRMKAPDIAYRIGYTGPPRTLRHVIAAVRADMERSPDEHHGAPRQPR